MKVIWNNEKFLSSREIIKIMEEKKCWKRTTTLTLLSRLTKKSLINTKKEKRLTYYTAAITEENYLRLETSTFFQKVHKSSLENFITTLYENNDITNKDLDELENWIKNR